MMWMYVFVGEICGYTVYKAHDSLPFRIVLLESMTGSANIYVAPDSTIEQEAYSFEIAPHDCILGSHGTRFVFSLAKWSRLYTVLDT